MERPPVSCMMNSKVGAQQGTIKLTKRKEKDIVQRYTHSWDHAKMLKNHGTHDDANILMLVPGPFAWGKKSGAFF